MNAELDEVGAVHVPGVLDDAMPEERKLGIEAGLAWLGVADAMVIYVDRGISPGMTEAIKLAKAMGIPVHPRMLENQD